eukprot:m.4134 g.4134  ORF g.4134 m.4134 type:complete len:77 (+) comp2177_c0_seq1:97-327(+)
MEPALQSSYTTYKKNKTQANPSPPAHAYINEKGPIGVDKWLICVSSCVGVAGNGSLACQHSIVHQTSVGTTSWSHP